MRMKIWVCLLQVASFYGVFQRKIANFATNPITLSGRKMLFSSFFHLRVSNFAAPALPSSAARTRRVLIVAGNFPGWKLCRPFLSSPLDAAVSRWRVYPSLRLARVPSRNLSKSRAMHNYNLQSSRAPGPRRPPRVFLCAAGKYSSSRACPLACLPQSARQGAAANGRPGKTAHNYRASLAAAAAASRSLHSKHRDPTRFLRRRIQTLKGGIACVIRLICMHSSPPRCHTFAPHLRH